MGWLTTKMAVKLWLCFYIFASALTKQDPIYRNNTMTFKIIHAQSKKELCHRVTASYLVQCRKTLSQTHHSCHVSEKQTSETIMKDYHFHVIWLVNEVMWLNDRISLVETPEDVKSRIKDFKIYIGWAWTGTGWDEDFKL